MSKSNIFNQVKSSVDIRYTVQKLLSNGRRENNEYVALNPTRDDQHLSSFRINLTNGKWIDHANGDKGGDITSLVAYIKGISQYEAASYLLGNSLNFQNYSFSSTLPKSAKTPKVERNTKEYVDRIWSDTFHAKDSVVETYLKNRGLLLEHIPRYIRFHPNLYHAPTKQYFPAMIAAVTVWSSDQVQAIHRTYLKADGSNKSYITPNKMMLGRVSGGAATFGCVSSQLIIAEGIETALSVYTATGFSTWASLSASGMVSVQVPPTNITQEIIIAADADATGIAAANKLAARLLDEGYKVSIATPSPGKDFNDLMKETKQ